MTWGLTAVAGATLVSGYMGSKATSSAAQAGADASGASIAEQSRQYDQTRTDQTPWREAGVNALAEMKGQKATPWKNFTMADYQADPGYAFRLSEGLKALDRSASARGGLLSGGALKGITRYAQDAASQEYGNAYSRFNTNQSNTLSREDTGYNRLASLAGVGQTANAAIQSAGQNAVNANTNALMTNATNQGNAALTGAQINASMFQGLGNTAYKYFNPAPTTTPAVDPVSTPVWT